MIHRIQYILILCVFILLCFLIILIGLALVSLYFQIIHLI